MTRDDDPTLPVPAADQPTDPIVAPHVPIADVQTADFAPVVTEAPRRGRGAGTVLGIVICIAAAALIGTVLALTVLPRGGSPVPSPSSSTVPSPTATVAVDPGPDPASPPDPTTPPVDPTPEPTATTEPTPEPTPSQTP